jgi:hypothetical protein
MNARRFMGLTQRQGPQPKYSRSWSGSCVTSNAGPHGERNSTRDEGGPFGFDDQESIPSHRKLLWSKAMVVSVAEKAGHDPVRRD